MLLSLTDQNGSNRTNISLSPSVPLFAFGAATSFLTFLMNDEVLRDELNRLLERENTLKLDFDNAKETGDVDLIYEAAQKLTRAQIEIL